MVPIALADGGLHISALRNAEAATGIEICSHCRLEAFDSGYDKSKNTRHHSIFLRHMKLCEANDGELITDVKLHSVQMLYTPHIQKRKIYEFLFAYNVPCLFKPIKSFITYDSETLEQRVDIKTAATDTTAHLVPFTVSYTSCVDKDMQPQLT